MNWQPPGSFDPTRALDAEIGHMVSEGWRVEWHGQDSAVLSRDTATATGAFLRGGLIGVMRSRADRRNPSRVTLTVTANGITKRYDYAG